MPAITKWALEISYPWDEYEIRYERIPISEVLELDLPSIVKDALEVARIEDGEVETVFTKTNTIRARVFFNSMDKLKEYIPFLKTARSYGLRCVYEFKSKIIVFTHSQNNLLEILEENREMLGSDIDNFKQWAKAIEENNGWLSSAYTEGMDTKLNLEIFFDNEEDWLAAQRALE